MRFDKIILITIFLYDYLAGNLRNGIATSPVMDGPMVNHVLKSPEVPVSMPAPPPPPPPPPCPPPMPMSPHNDSKPPPPAPIPPPPAGMMQAPDGAMTIKRKVNFCS